MIFTAPLVLLGLLALPAIWLLLRLNPPRPRVVKFPPLALLRDLTAEQRTPYRLPLWILLLRLVATALVVLGLAGPSLHPPPALPGGGPVLLVIDNGWEAVADWPRRIEAAQRVIAAAAAAGRGVALLATAPDATGAAPHLQGVMPARQAGQMVAALNPQPWPVDRRAATVVLSTAPAATRIYLADGTTGGADFAAFMRALRPDRIIGGGGALPALLGPPELSANGELAVTLLSGPGDAVLLAEDEAGNVLGRTGFDRQNHAVIGLPAPLADRITALTLAGPPSAGGTALLDGSRHLIRAGLAATGNNADTPFLGAFYFIRRALPPGGSAVTGSLAALASKTNLLFLVDTPLDEAAQELARDFVVHGGVLVRFAGKLTAAAPDQLTPDPLLAGDRRLGGALSWTTPLGLTSFAAGGPLAGITPDPAATVSRQVLADPVLLDPTTVWASLSDGTPLVIGKRIGRGYLISVLTTANTDWSNLAISGLFPEMLARLAALARGGPATPQQTLTIQSALSAFGKLAPASRPASITARAFPLAPVSPAAPPGIYGSGSASLALNLGGHVAIPVRAALPGAVPLTGQVAQTDFAGALIAAGLLLLLVDLAVSLWLRGLIRRPAMLAAAVLLFLLPSGPGHAQMAALQTELGYLRSNDPATDQLAADALAFISADVSARSSASLGDPVGLDPAVDDLGLYPLIYWMVLPSAPTPAPAACTALASYMAHGGLLVIDTPGSDAGGPGSGAGFAPGAAAAVGRVTACLSLPPLAPLTAADTLAHCFYIVPDFPGRFTGAPVLAATPEARDADGVTPVIIGQNDWAGAWARDDDGDTEQTPIPGGDAQRVIADRFATNLVIYALTGSYKADQAAAPALLDKLGQ